MYNIYSYKENIFIDKCNLNVMVRSKAVNTKNKIALLTIIKRFTTARLILATPLLFSLINFNILDVFSMNWNLFSATLGKKSNA